MIAARSISREIDMVGDVGDLIEGEFISVSRVRAELARLGPGDLTVHLNSGGGDAFDGLAIYNALKAHPGRITVIVEALAASAASLIAMAGTRILMRPQSFLMIHDAFGLTMGNAAAHEAQRHLLDTISGTYAEIYSEKSGKSEGDIRDLMRSETWFTADEAVKIGLADGLFENNDAAFGIPASKALAGYRNLPNMKGLDMESEERDIDVLPEKQWAPRFYRRMANTGLSAADLNAIVAASSSESRATDAVVDAVATRRNADKPSAAGGFIRVGAGDDEQFREEMVAALAADLAGKRPGDRANRFMGASFTEKQRAFLARHGVDTSRMSDRRVFEAAMRPGGRGRSIWNSGALHTPSDFPELLGEAGNRFLEPIYRAALTPLHQIARTVPVPDKRPRVVLRQSDIAIEEIADGAEIKNVTIAEEAQSYVNKTGAGLIAISRDLQINDDLGAFSDAVRIAAQSAVKWLNREIAAAFLANEGAGASLSDRMPFYHANRANILTGPASALSLISLSEARRRLRTARALGDGEPVGYRPAYLQVGPENETVAEQLLAAIAAAKVTDVNPFAGTMQLLVEPRLPGGSWRVFADPAQAPAFEVSYLNGVESPRIEQRDGWRRLGTEFRVVFDAGVGLIDPRASVLSVGA